MRTNYVNPRNPARYSRDLGNFAIVAAAGETSWAKAEAAKRRADADAKKNAQENISKFTPETQPRDPNGKFRKILARLKNNLGEKATEELAKGIEKAEAAQIAGNYEEMKKAGGDVIKMIGDIKEGDLPKGATKNLRRGAENLGKVMAYLPLPQGNPNAKIRFSDLPPGSADLVRSMVKRVIEQLGQEKAKKYTAALEQYMSGARSMDSDEMASNLNKLLRVLA